VRLCGTIVEVDAVSGRALAIERLVVRDAGVSSDG
jgi:hypothetical protein